MSKSLLSIIMPVYNTEKYVSEAIQSIFDQTFRDFELIIIEDGSTDSSLNIIKSFNDDRLKIHINRENKGIVFSRNKGLELAKGKYIGILDSDDIAYPNRFEVQIDFLEKNLDFGMIGSWARLIDQDGKRVGKNWKLRAKPEMIPSIMLFNNYFVQSSVVCRSEIMKQFSYDPSFELVEDYLLWININKEYKTWNLQRYLVDYRIHDQGVTIKKMNEGLKKEEKLFIRQFNYLDIEPTDDELELHNLIRHKCESINKKTLVSIEKWLIKILRKNEEKNIYNHRMLILAIFNRWIKACINAKGLHIKALFIFIRFKLLLYYLTSYRLK